MLKTGLNILSAILTGSKPVEKVKKKPDTVSWALAVANHVLETKSKGKYYLFEPKQRPAGFYEHPHSFGCQIKDRNAPIAGVVKFAGDIQNELFKWRYTAQVTMRENPMRLEILKPSPPPILFESYWGGIKQAVTNEFGFNGVVFYSDVAHNPVFSLAKATYAHCAFLGATGSGKTVLMYDALLSLAMRNSPESLSIVLCDRKGDFLPLSNRGEFPAVSGLPHLACPVLTNLDDIAWTIKRVVGEMHRRVENKAGALRNRILLIVDEFSNTASDDPGILDDCLQIAREGRGLGVHLWIGAQKMAGSKNFPPEFYQNLSTRFVGSTRGNRAEAEINGGPGSQAHNLPTGQGVFEFSNGGLLLGHPTPVTVRSMYIPEVEKHGVKVVDAEGYVQEIRDRWSGKPPHFTIHGSWKKPLLTPPLDDRKFLEVLAWRATERKLNPARVRKAHRELFGHDLKHREAEEIMMVVREGLCFA